MLPVYTADMCHSFGRTCYLHLQCTSIVQKLNTDFIISLQT